MTEPTLKTGQINSKKADLIYGQRDAAVSDLHTRNAALGEPDDQQRTVPATLVTETPVTMFDWRRGVVFDEVLQASGAKWRSHVVLLDNHNRFDSRAVLGSVENLTQRDASWEGTLRFLDSDPDVDPIWNRVKQRHLRGVSAGYRYAPNACIIIQPGQSAVVAGKRYEAHPDREMRVVQEWEGYEASVTPIQADGNSHTRSGENSTKTCPAASQVHDGFELQRKSASDSQPNRQINRSENVGYLEYLRSIGLADGATQSEVDTFHRSLSGEQRTQADSLRSVDNPLPSASEQSSSDTTQQRSAGSEVSPPASDPAPASDPVAVERERVQQIRALADGLSVENTLVTRAIDGGWDLARVRQEFSDARPTRTPPAQTQQESQAPAGHVRSGSGPSLQALQAALLMREMGNSGHDLDSPLYQNRSVEAAFRRSGAHWVCEHSRALAINGTPNDGHARAAEEAYELRSMPMVEMCRHILRLNNQPHSGYDYRDIVTRALSAPQAASLFTTSFNALLLSEYVTVADTTRPWTSETDLPNWQPAERHQRGLSSRLRKKARGAAPEQTTFDASMEIIRVETFSERFEMTREDIMDDRLGGLDLVPQDLGEAAAELRPDLVYATLLSNPNMADGNPLFGNIAKGIKNLTGGLGYAATDLDAAKTKFATQTINGRLVREKADYWVVPESKEWTAKRLIESDEDRTTAADVDRGTKNPAKGAFSVIAEPRLDAGVINPSNDAQVAGQPNSWFLASAGGRRGLQVAYLRSDGRGPITEAYNLTEGRIGMGWTIEMVIGTKAVGRSGIAKAQQASL